MIMYVHIHNYYNYNTNTLDNTIVIICTKTACVLCRNVAIDQLATDDETKVVHGYIYNEPYYV